MIESDHDRCMQVLPNYSTERNRTCLGINATNIEFSDMVLAETMALGFLPANDCMATRLRALHGERL